MVRILHVVDGLVVCGGTSQVDIDNIRGRVLRAKHVLNPLAVAVGRLQVDNHVHVGLLLHVGIGNSLPCCFSARACLGVDGNGTFVLLGFGAG